MTIEISEKEKPMYLTIMLGGWQRLVYKIFKESDEDNKKRIMKAMAEFMQELEPVMEMFGLEKNAEGVARAMILTEDLIGCEPRGELLSVSPDEAVRKVISCPWAESFEGDTCRLTMQAMEEGLGRKLGLEIFCEQNLAEGAEYCIWKVRKKK